MGWILAQFKRSECTSLFLDVRVPTTGSDSMRHLCSGRVYNLIKSIFYSILTLALSYTIHYMIYI